MPWCEECAKYYTPNSVNPDGTCPSCGDAIQLPDGVDDASDDVERELDEAAPWHFKLMVAMVVLYLGWRVVQLVT